RLRYLPAAHWSVFFLQAATGILQMLPVQGLPLGVAPNLEYSNQAEVSFARGDVLAIFTDGFFEWAGADERYGIERLQERLGAYRELSAADMIQRIYQDVLTFAKGTPQLDDLTAVVVKKQ